MTDILPGRAGPRLLGTGEVDRSQPGQPWWRYRRPDVPAPAPGAAAPAPAGEVPGDAGPAAPNGPAPAGDGTPGSVAPGGDLDGLTPATVRSPIPLAVAGGATLVLAAMVARFGIDGAGRVLVPVAGLFFAAAVGRHVATTRPGEAWLGRWLLLGVAAKLVASWFRYYNLVVGYEGVGDASGYDQFGKLFALAWNGGGTAPELPDLRRTNYLRWFTGVVYYVFGSDMLLGFFVFGLLALIGSYLWYRAAAEALPFLDRRWFLAFMLFAPSIAFWPSSIGKEALMQLGLGAVALGASLLFRQRLLAGLAVSLAGGWQLWVVRPHLLALSAVAAGLAYLTGRVRDPKTGKGNLVTRPIGLVVIAFLVVFTVAQGAQFLGIEDLSISSIEQELDAQTERSAQGGSEFDNGGNSLNPIYLPRGAATVLLRPFPWETESPLQLLASLESAIVAALIVVRWSSIRAALARVRTFPFTMYCFVLLAEYAMTFSSFANFGLLVRQRSLVLPALFCLLSIDPRRAKDAKAAIRARRGAPGEEPVAPAALVPPAAPVRRGLG